MNERELIERQLAVEHAHLKEVAAALARACAAPTTAAHTAWLARIAPCSAYLRTALARSRARSAAHRDRLEGRADAIRRPAGAPVVRGETARAYEVLTADIAGADRVLEALTAVRERVSGSSATKEEICVISKDCSDYLANFETMTGPLLSRLTAQYSLADWRETAQIDADSMLEERRLYAAVPLS